ncbi:MAG: hypothetical protein BAJALOKI1v1_20023 [Promethearchaeota archaeon]|nr:MAG: hypothetical protein BAJALOKI1v1_20023 [Candidatus Lokiarchaeota archaeon]
MNNLKIILHKGHILLKSARATHHSITDDIILYLPNIMKDIVCDCENLADAIDRLVLTEIICSTAIKSSEINRRLCEGKYECPIRKILRKIGLSYELNLSFNQEKTREHKNSYWKVGSNNLRINKKIKYSKGDGIPLLLPQPPPMGGKILTRSPS